MSTLATVGCSDRRRQRGAITSVLLHTDTNAILCKSIKIRPSVIGYIAISIALVSKGERDAGYRVCDIAFEHFHASHVSFLLLIKVLYALELSCPSAAHFV